MKRNAIDPLIHWKETADGKPMLITGMKGVGKTYLGLDFAKSFFDGYLYINFENTASIREYVKHQMQQGNLSLLHVLYEYYQIPEELVGKFIVIIDELQESHEAEQMMIHDLESASSEQEKRKLSMLLLISSSTHTILQKHHSFLHQIKLYPMGFDEFLIASGQEWYADVIQGHYQTNRRIPKIVHGELLNIFEDYLMIGGMPAALNEYLTSDATDNISEIHHRLYHNFLQSACCHVPTREIVRIEQLFRVVAEQLIKDNKKFQFCKIRRGATYQMYFDAIEHLTSSEYLIRCNKWKNDKEQTGFLHTNESNQLKLYLSDVGILSSLIKKQFVIPEAEKETIRKTLIENYVIQAMHSNQHHLEFWESSSLAKIEFLLKNRDGIIPIEVKSTDNSRSKSIGVFRMQNEIPYSIRISSRNYEFCNGIKYIPYYAIFCL